MDSHANKSVPMANAFVESFIRNLRANPWLANTHGLFVPERNTGREGGRLWDIIKQFTGFSALYTDNERDPGIWTDNPVKVAYNEAAYDRVSARSVCFMRNFVTTDPVDAKEDRRKIKAREFVDQMRRVRPLFLNSTSAGSTSRLTYSGCVNEEGKLVKGLRDDLWLVFSAICYVIRQLRRGMFPHTSSRFR